MNSGRLSFLRWVIIGLLAMVIILPGTLTLAGSSVPFLDSASLTSNGGYSLSCPFGTGGDNFGRGFYIDNFTGTTLNTVTLGYWSNTAGSYTVELTAREGAYNGLLISTVSLTFSHPGGGMSQQTFDFGGALVNNSIITFSQNLVSGPGSLSLDVGTGTLGATGTGLCPGLTETGGTTPPLDSHRRDTVGVIITGGGEASVPGCGAYVSAPSHSVGGRFVSPSALHWMPGSPLSPALTVPAGQTAWVTGIDESSQYYQIIWGCQKLWVPVETMGPNYDNVWNGQPLPNVVVE